MNLHDFINYQRTHAHCHPLEAVLDLSIVSNMSTALMLGGGTFGGDKLSRRADGGRTDARTPTVASASTQNGVRVDDVERAAATVARVRQPQYQRRRLPVVAGGVIHSWRRLTQPRRDLRGHTNQLGFGGRPSHLQHGHG